MADSVIAMGFSDSWFWLIFVVIGLLMILLELIVGVETGFDLVFLGSAFILGGRGIWQKNSWILTVIVTSMICAAYVTLGRRYVQRLKLVGRARTNIDAVIGRNGIVLQSISKNADGLVKVGHEQWRARAEEDIKKGDEIVVTNISGVTLIVEKIKGGN